MFSVHAVAGPVYYTDTYSKPQLATFVLGLKHITTLPGTIYGSAYANGVESIPGTNTFIAKDRAGIVYQVDTSGQQTVMLDVAARIGASYTSAGGQKGLQYAVVHPGFSDPASDGYQKIYTTTTETLIPDNAQTVFSLPTQQGLNIEHYDVVSEWDLSGAVPVRSTLVVAESPYGDHNVR